MFQLSMSQAASAKMSRKLTLNVPGLYQHHIDKIRSVYFKSGMELPFKSYKIHWRVIIRRLGLYAIAPMCFFIIRKFPTDGFLSLPALLWLLFILFTSIIYWRKWSFHINEEGIQTEQGIIGTKFTLLKWYKIQSVKIQQSIFQKRRALCDIHFYTAAGEVKIPYIPIEVAERLKNYILFKVETSRKSWM